MFLDGGKFGFDRRNGIKKPEYDGDYDQYGYDIDGYDKDGFDIFGNTRYDANKADIEKSQN